MSAAELFTCVLVSEAGCERIVGEIELVFSKVGIPVLFFILTEIAITTGI